MAKNVFRLSFTLLAICAVCTALVVGAHDYTNSIIAEREAAKVIESYAVKSAKESRNVCPCMFSFIGY